MLCFSNRNGGWKPFEVYCFSLFFGIYFRIDFSSIFCVFAPPNRCSKPRPSKVGFCGPKLQSPGHLGTFLGRPSWSHVGRCKQKPCKKRMPKKTLKKYKDGADPGLGVGGMSWAHRSIASRLLQRFCMQFFLQNFAMEKRLAK